jgi:hypothetical protein
VDALFAGAAQPAAAGSVVSQPSAVAVDVAFAASSSDAATAPTAAQSRVEAGSLPHVHHGDGAATLDAAGLSDPLADAL